MCPRKRDREEIELLQELQQLQAREPLLDIEPPALIDQAVRNLARRDLRHKSSSPVAGNLRWIAGLSTVSIALIALGISMVQAPPSPGPGNESFESRETESRSSDESPMVASPDAPQLSRSAPAPAADAAATAEAQSVAVDTDADATAAAMTQESSARKENLAKESASADFTDESTQAAGVSKSVDSDLSQAEETSAQAWLDLIEQLYEQGLHTEAAKQLLAWQAKYPDLPLPDWATTLLRVEPEGN